MEKFKTETGNRKTEEKGKQPMSKTKRYAVVCLCAAVLIGAGVVLGAWFSEGEPEAEPIVERVYVQRDHVGSRGVVITEENFEEFNEMVAIADHRFAHYRTNMSMDWIFETATSPSYNMFVENHYTNPGTVFFDLMLDGETIFSSPYIPLGARLDSITLDVELPPGEYRPIVVYHLVDEDYEVQATLSVGITLRVLG